MWFQLLADERGRGGKREEEGKQEEEEEKEEEKKEEEEILEKFRKDLKRIRRKYNPNVVSTVNRRNGGKMRTWGKI